MDAEIVALRCAEMGGNVAARRHTGLNDAGSGGLERRGERTHLGELG